jgi:thioredoxin 1
MTRPVLYDFFATWCGPCKIQSPIIDSLAERIGGKVDIEKVDIDQFPDLANKYLINVVPTLIIEKDGKVVHRLEGVTDASHLETLLNSLY